MARINSRKKGSRNERNVADVLEEWTKMEFAKTPASGGLNWNNRLAISGDVVPTDPFDMVRFPFTIETKFYDEIEFQDPILGNESDLLNFWSQASIEGERSKKIPMVLMRRNRMPKDLYFVILSLRIFRKIRNLMTFPYGFYNYNNEIVIFPSRDLFRISYDSVELKLKGEHGKDNSNSKG